jgi:hypothetical protein
MAGAVLTSEMKDGWLTFESVASRLRRLAPVPENWDQLSGEQLEQLCNQASEVRHAAPRADTRAEISEPNDDPH